MTTNDFKIGLADAAEVCEGRIQPMETIEGTLLPSGAKNNDDMRRAAQACREAVKLRELLDEKWASIVAALNRWGDRNLLDQVRRDLSK